MTWGDRPKQTLPSGLDLFDKLQEPRIEISSHPEDQPLPADLELISFVMDRIRHAESEPRIDGIPRIYSETHGAMVHRYAGYVRADMVAFRRIVAEFVSYASTPFDGEQTDALRVAVKAIATRWSDHPDFRTEWRL
jgi:hypothetical protein